MSNRLRILVAAGNLPKVFDETDLIVEAWRVYPEAFGLGRHPHPNAVRVLAKVHGETGLINSGMLKRVESGISLTQKGAEAARRFVLGEKPEPKTKPRPPKQTRPCRDHGAREIETHLSARSSSFRDPFAAAHASPASSASCSSIVEAPRVAPVTAPAVPSQASSRKTPARGDLSPVKPPQRFLGSPIVRC